MRVDHQPRGCRHLPGAAILAAALAAASAAPAQDSAVKLGIGADYSTGDYGTGQNVDIWTVPVTARLLTGRWNLELKVPFTSITSAGDVVGGTDAPIVTKKKKVAGSNARTTEAGLGDIVGSVGFAMLPGTGGLPLLELVGKVKFPTASEKDGLGTGEFDYSAQLDLTHTIGRFTPFGTIGYRVIGEPSGTDLNNIFFATLGAGYAFNDRLSAGLAVDYKQATTGGADDPLEVTPYVSWKVTRRWALDFYALVGLSEGSPDAGGGVRLSATY